MSVCFTESFLDNATMGVCEEWLKLIDALSINVLIQLEREGDCG